MASMKLDPGTCYRAVLSRDARFDGRFFTGVKTTGIYCRPICPAVTPRRENVTFFACAAAAEDAGFRPCLRCRPERSPWFAGSDQLVRQALTLIDHGLLDEEPLEALSDRLGIGARHLRRLFRRHLGTTPAAVARTRRLHLARKLIQDTTLPLTEVAFASGFASLRRFNSVFRENCGMPPSQLRRTTRPRSETIRLRLAYRPPLDWEGMLRFLAARSIPGVERVGNGVYSRTVQASQQTGRIEVRHVPSEQALEVLIPESLSRCAGVIVAGVSRLFDLTADTGAIGEALAQDPLLAPLLARHPGVRVPGAFEPFETAVRGILGQQVSVRAATTLAGRIVRRLGRRILEDEPGWIFPGPEAMLGLPEDLGVPARRRETLEHLAREVAAARLDLRASSKLEESLTRLQRIPGIGPWTAGYLCLRVLGEPDGFPEGDLALRKRLGLTASRLSARARAWRPWRGYAAMLLWWEGEPA